ncbi:hypothetical protein [Alicyclobacillus sacchari]|uniref:hypothetical protein n=1 Tax=Alicyclobacillus sacchari TaxID=392010 RepID=UPI0024E06CCC|nr:hypothetical protein [Alicyclobacillus sacchari]
MAIAVSLIFIPGQRMAIYAGVPIIVIVLLSYYLFYRRRIQVPMKQQTMTE